MNIFYVVVLILTFYVCMNSSTVTKHSMDIDNIKYNDFPTINIVPMDKVSRWVKIPTYDGSGETTHPKVLYFKDGFNEYKYWMVNTPYPHNNAYLENPSIIVSNDGVNWTEPDGIKNPVSGYPSKIRDDSYYSDPFMLFDNDHFELFFRKTKSNLNGNYKRNGYNYVYMQTSSDGITWTKPKMILNDNSLERYMSMSIIKENGLYKIWYVNYEGNIRYIESSDLINYTKPINVNISNFKSNVWHGEIQNIDEKYICIFMIKYKLFYTESIDGVNFDEPKLINTEVESIKDKINHIYKSTYVVSDDYIELYVPYRVNYKWRLHYTKISKSEFFLNF